MTDKMVEISHKSLSRIHDRNRELDTENHRKEREIEILKEMVEKLTLRGLPRVKQPV